MLSIDEHDKKAAFQVVGSLRDKKEEIIWSPVCTRFAKVDKLNLTPRRSGKCVSCNPFNLKVLVKLAEVSIMSQVRSAS